MDPIEVRYSGDFRVHKVAALTDGRRWVAHCAADRLVLGALDAPEVTDLRHTLDFVEAIGAIGPTRILATDGQTVSSIDVDRGGEVARWMLPARAELLRSAIAVDRSGQVRIVTSGPTIVRLTDDGPAVEAQAEPGGEAFERSYLSAALGEDGRVLALGGGDGRIEIRDALTLELRKVLTPFGLHRFSAVLAVAFVDARTVVAASDDRRFGLVDVETGAFTLLALATESVPLGEGLSLAFRGGGKVSGLHALGGGRFVAVGLSRQVSVFEGAVELRSGFYDDVLGNRYVQGSALVDEGRAMILACEEKGVVAVGLDQLRPVGLFAEDPRVRLHALLQQAGDPTAIPRLRPVAEALTRCGSPDVRIQSLRIRDMWGDDLRDEIVPDLRGDDPSLQDNAIRLAVRPGQVDLLAELPALYARAGVPVRRLVVDAYGAFGAEARARAPDLRVCLADADDLVVRGAVWSLGQLGDRDAIEWVRPFVRDRRTGMAATATEALLRLGADAAGDLVSAIREGFEGVSFQLAMLRGAKLPVGALTDDEAAGLTARVPADRLRDVLRRRGVEIADGPLPEVFAEVGSVRSLPQLVGLFVTVTGWATVFDEHLRITTPEAGAVSWEARLTGGA